MKMTMINCEMKIKLYNLHGYKVCFREKGDKEYTVRFLTHTYKQAKSVKKMYLRSPSIATLYNRPLKKPEWVIIPIKKSEVRDGIWHEVPFWKQKRDFFFLQQNQKLGGKYNDYIKSHRKRYRTRTY